MSTMFDHFHQPFCTVVIGATGGIGHAMMSLLEAEPQAGEAFAFARQPERIRSDRTQALPIDITVEDSIAAAAARASADGPLDLVVVTTGLLHQGSRIRPEKTMRRLDADVMADVFRINAIAPAIIAKHFLPRLRHGFPTVFAALSARVGSIGDNHRGGWTSYRASKAALNMIIRTLAIEQRMRNRDSIVAALHPGTVDTGLSSPFQANVPARQLFSPSVAVHHLLHVIGLLKPDDSGGFFAWDGQSIEY